MTDINDNKDNDYICNKLTNNVYKACVQSYEKNRTIEINVSDIPNYATCSSSNFRAIAEANFECFQMHLTAAQDSEKIEFYREKWIRYEEITVRKENEEYNTKVNRKWVKCKKEPKELWSMVDWKGNVREDSRNELSYHEIYQFFDSIFQSKKTVNAPVLADVQREVDEYNVSIPVTDKNVCTNEIDIACRNMGKGIGIDGLPPIIAKLLPESIKNILQHLFQAVFDGKYPEAWEKQLLFPIKKKDHAISNPKLRGIGIGQMFSRLYDDVMNQRFCSWFTPNMEQAATAGQGCVFQIFALLLLIDFAKISNKSLLIGLLDFEKAYDFTNRAILITDMMKKGAGKKLVRAISNMYSNTSYTPKVGKNSIGEPITTNFGVTQGRKSSGNLYAFAISEMPNSVRDNTPKDFMDPFCMAQLADDTSISAESIRSMTGKFQKVIDYSGIKHQHVNTINHRDYWVNDDGTDALWYMPISKDWMFGDVKVLGSTTVRIASNNNLASQCPYDERHTYRYWNGKTWIYTEDVHQSCVTVG